MTAFDVDSISLDQLRKRRSAKWRYFEPDVLPAWIAEMDFPLADPIESALRAAIDNSDTGYLGLEGLGSSFSDFARQTWSWNVAEEHVSPLPDVLSGIAQTLLLLTAPGDRVVINPPVYHPFFSTITDVAHRAIVEVPMLRDEDGRYDWDLDGLERAFAREDVTAFVMSNPHNPTGTVASRATLERIAMLSATYQVVVVSDEIHAPLLLPGSVHVPYLTVAADDANAVVLVSASKAWNIPGLKCAQLISTARTRETLVQHIPLEVTYATGHLGAMASVAAYEHGGPWLEQVVAILDENRRLVTAQLAEHIPRAWYRQPEASYLAWIDMGTYGLGDDPAEIILDRGRVALSPGPAFGTGGSGFVRLNFATSPAILAEIVRRVATVIQ